MYPKLDYDIEKDFDSTHSMASVPQVLVVNPKNWFRQVISMLSWSWCARVAWKVQLRVRRNRHVTPSGW
jgi:hypothetical protein